MDTHQLDIHYRNIRELDSFEQESRNRKIIQELVRPLFEDMDKDRRNAARIDCRLKQMEERMRQVEFLSGVSEQKPQVF